MQRKSSPSKLSQKESQNEGLTMEVKKDYYQFGGPIGAFLTSVCMIGWTYFVVEKKQSGKWNILQIPEFPGHWRGWLDVEVSVIFLGWLAVQWILYLLPMGGPIKLGTPTKNTAQRLEYRQNAFFVMVLNMTAIVMATFAGIHINIINEKALQMLTTALLFFFILSIILYIKAMSLSPRELSPQGQTGSSFYNWFIGRELHPRLGFLDIKYVTFRSNLIGILIFNWASAVEAYENDNLTMSLVVVCMMQLAYVSDILWFEDDILFFRDVVHEALGFNTFSLFLTIPVTFSVQTRYLAKTGFTLPWYCLLFITGIYLTGQWILRSSYSEKTNFRRNPSDPAFTNYKTLPTKIKGKALLVSGWWGMTRHPNYFGDFILSFAFAFPTGFGHFMPYLNPLVSVMVLLDRERIDGAECKERYGAVWDQYCEKVKYRIIPGVY